MSAGDELRTGSERARLSSRRQALTRAFLQGMIIGGCWFLIPWPWWGRLLCILGGFLVYGMIASTDRLHRWL